MPISLRIMFSFLTLTLILQGSVLTASAAGARLSSSRLQYETGESAVITWELTGADTHHYLSVTRPDGREDILLYRIQVSGETSFILNVAGTYVFRISDSADRTVGEPLTVTAMRSPVLRSTRQLKSFLASYPFDVNAEDTFEVTPAPSEGVAGKLTDESIASALNALNFLRYTAGVGADVRLDEGQGNYAQSGAALLSYIGRGLDHTPAMPDGLPEELYSAGYQGTTASNLSRGYKSVAESVVSGYFADGFEAAASEAARRRWCLNPLMTTTGFGHAGDYLAMYAFGTEQDAVPYPSVVWPARTMPVEFYGGPWSISLSPDIYTAPEADDNIRITLTGAERTQFFDLSSGARFKIDPTSYGGMPALIFAPIVTPRPGESFRVTVEGLKYASDNSPALLRYTVRFTTLGWETDYADVSASDWFCSDTEVLLQKGIMDGTSAGNFSPDSTLTRAMAVTVLYRIEGEPAPGQDTFPDVERSAWYARAVSWASEKGIVRGYSDGTFGTYDNITRQDLVTLLYRYANVSSAGADGPLPFADSEAVSAYAVPAVRWAYDSKIVSGRASSDGIARFDPLGQATRAEFAAIIRRFLDR